MKIVSSTGTLTYRLVLTSRLPGPSLLGATTIAVRATLSETSPKANRDLPQRRILALCANTGSHMRELKAIYEADYDSRVRQTPT